jgi:hypothetical protein
MTTPRLLRRGVYLAPFTLHGDRYFYAVDDAGEQIGMRTVPIGADATGPIDELWTIVDARCGVMPDDAEASAVWRPRLIAE